MYLPMLADHVLVSVLTVGHDHEHFDAVGVCIVERATVEGGIDLVAGHEAAHHGLQAWVKQGCAPFDADVHRSVAASFERVDLAVEINCVVAQGQDLRAGADVAHRLGVVARSMAPPAA